jgi:integrase
MPEALKECGNIRDRWLTKADFDRLLEQATPHRRHWLIMYAHTGADISELHKARKREDVDLGRGEHGAIRLRGTKTKHRDRWIPLSADARAVVDERMDEPGGMLFDPAWSSQAFAVCMQRWCPKAGIERVIVKDLRRTFCSWMCQAGVPMHTVEKLMGHANSRMIKRIYGQLSDENFEHAIAALPSVANTCQAKVIPIGIRRENDTPSNPESVENA